MRRVTTLAAVGLAAVLLSSCTLVPTMSKPRVIPHSQVGPGLGLNDKSIPGTNNARVRFVTQPVYIVDTTGHLAPSSRIVASPPSLYSVLRVLVLGPTDIEKSAGYSSQLPKNFVVVAADIKKKIGYVNIAEPLSTLPARQRVLAAGQLALTAQDIGATRGIEILVGGVVQNTLLPNGTTRRIVNAQDFATLMNP
ncbi:MAG: GerMN domain-containing protein [Acidimicrobiales bacterium]